MHDVIAAIKIEPSEISKSFPSTLEDLKLFLFVVFSKTFLKFTAASLNNTLSCGLLGPDIVGTI